MKTIIAAVDFSPNSTNAGYYAADIASAIGAELLLMHAVELPASVVEIPVSSYLGDDQMLDTMNELAELKKSLVSHTGNKIEIKTNSTFGTMPFQLKLAAEQENTILIVMGTDKATGIIRLLLPNHTLDAMDNLQNPVLIVPADALFSGFHKVVLASDLQEFEDYQALQTLRNFLKAFHPKLHILHIQKQEQPGAAVVPGSIELANELGEFQPALHFLKSTNIQEAVWQFTEEQKPDLLIVIPKKHGLLAGLFYKSKARSLVMHAQVPVLTIHE